MNAINLHPFNESTAERKLSNTSIYPLRGETLSLGATPQLGRPWADRSGGVTCTHTTLSDPVPKRGRHATAFLPLRRARFSAGNGQREGLPGTMLSPQRYGKWSAGPMTAASSDGRARSRRGGPGSS